MNFRKTYFSIGFVALISTIFSGISLVLLRWQPRFCSIFAGIIWTVLIISWVLFNLMVIIWLTFDEVLSTPKNVQADRYTSDINKQSQADFIDNVKEILLFLSWVLLIGSFIVFATLMIILISIAATGINKISKFMLLSTR